MQNSTGHNIIAEEFEDHLGGGASQAFYDHLKACPDCRTQLSEIDRVTSFMSELKSAGDSAPPVPLGFYNRVAAGVREQQGSGPWDLFSNSALFFRRVAFAALLLMAVMGGVLATRDMGEPGADDVTVIMARHDAFAVHEESADRDQLLVTLASYGR